jgi:hypothetical protein
MAILAPHSDRAVQEYRHRSGARDTYWLNELVKYVRSQGLYDSFRLYPFMPRTNADSGSTAYGLGGLTSNDMTLVNGPTWTSSGLQFVSSSSQFGSISDFLGSETLTVFARVSHASATPTAVNTIASQYDAANDERSWLFNYQGNVANDPYRLARSADGTSAEVYEDDGADAGTTDRCLVAQWVDGGGRSLWVNKTGKTLTLSGGSEKTSRFNSPEPVVFSALISGGTPANYADHTAHALAFLTGTVTTAQRETITDMINEL